MYCKDCRELVIYSPDFTSCSVCGKPVDWISDVCERAIQKYSKISEQLREIRVLDAQLLNKQDKQDKHPPIKEKELLVSVDEGLNQLDNSITFQHWKDTRGKNYGR